MGKGRAALPKFGPERCPVYLRCLPWLGSVSTRFEKQVKSAVKQCFSAVEPRVVYHRASLLFQQGCTACFTENQRDLSIFMPLWQSVFRPYFLKAAGQNQTTCPQIYLFLFFFPETLTSCPSVLIFHPIKTQPLASDSAIWLHLLQNPTCAQHNDNSRFLFLPMVALLSIYPLLKPLISKLLTPPSADKKRIPVQLKDCALMTLSLISLFQPFTTPLFSINSRSFSCALHSGDSSGQLSDEKLRRYEHFNQGKRIFITQLCMDYVLTGKKIQVSLTLLLDWVYFSFRIFGPMD